MWVPVLTPRMHCSVRLCVCMCAQVHVLCEREERGLSPKAIFVNGKVLKYLQMDLRTLQNRTVSISKQPGSIWCLLSSGKFPLWAELPSFSFSPAHFKWHDLIKHFSIFNCMPRLQGIICWVAPSGLSGGVRKDTSIQKGAMPDLVLKHNSVCCLAKPSCYYEQACLGQ